MTNQKTKKTHGGRTKALLTAAALILIPGSGIVAGAYLLYKRFKKVEKDEQSN